MGISSNPNSEDYHPEFARYVQLSGDKTIPPHERTAAEKKVWAMVRLAESSHSIGVCPTWSNEFSHETHLKLRRQHYTKDTTDVDKDLIRIKVEQKAEALSIGFDVSP